MTARQVNVPRRRAIIDRAALAEALAGDDRNAAARRLKDALAAGRAEIDRRLLERPYAGTETAAAYAFLTDQVLRLVFDYVTERLHPLANPTTSERLLLMAVGGYGRGEMALHSDVDIAFVTPWKPSLSDQRKLKSSTASGFTAMMICTTLGRLRNTLSARRNTGLPARSSSIFVAFPNAATAPTPVASACEKRLPSPAAGRMTAIFMRGIVAARRVGTAHLLPRARVERAGSRRHPSRRTSLTAR